MAGIPERIAFLMLLVCMARPVSADEAPVVTPPGSILEAMVTVITPATDILWNVEDPVSDEAWRKLEDAARAVVNSGAAIKLGGSGPNDNKRASQVEWQSFSAAMINAAEQARDAIRDKNLDALFDAGDALYQPCEGCHLQYNPAVTNQ